MRYKKDLISFLVNAYAQINPCNTFNKYINHFLFLYKFCTYTYTYMYIYIAYIIKQKREAHVLHKHIGTHIIIINL